jgi:general secretion pathway protein D/MSHA biogenesis protein MshL
MIDFEEHTMRINVRLLVNIFLAMTLTLLLCSCADKEKEEKPEKTTADLVAEVDEGANKVIIAPSLLPSRFQRAGYMMGENDDDAKLDAAIAEEFKIKVGANISTSEPIPLRDAMKALVRNKKMGLSWASDVDQNLLVDVDVTASDDFYEAIDNILRQLDYFHEVQGKTIVIKYRQTKQYHIAMPFTKQVYETAVGGNILGSNEASASTEGTVRLDSRGNKFDIWKNIKDNIDVLIATWGTTVTTTEVKSSTKSDEEGADNPEGEAEVAQQVSHRVSSTDSSYTIDKPVGLITVHAPRSLQVRIKSYLDTLEKELYKQIIIEAKIIEVQLKDNSSLGINWNQLLKNLSWAGGAASASTSYQKSNNDSKSNSDTFSHTTTEGTSSTTSRTVGSDGVSTRTNTYDHETGTVNGDTSANTLTSTESSSNNKSRTLTDSLSWATTAATTAATLVTGGAANAAAGGIALASFSFDSFINALSDQGETSILSNPKLSVMNGQPALISVGRNVTYVDSIQSTVEGSGSDSTTTYTVDTERILSGVALAISAVVKRDNEIVMNLVPITSELAEPIEYVEFGGGKVGLPIVNIREMSTTVKIKDGGMLVVGGLISEVESKDGDFIYGTENIPYLKYLFGYEEKKKVKRELIILLRPRII